MNDDPGIILLTGGTGLVGGELLRRLAGCQPGPRPVALVRREQSAERLRSMLGVESIIGDLRDPSCVLPDEQAARVIGIIHCAADTRFDLPLGEARLANVATTAQALHIARRCRNLQKFAMLSTVFVAGLAAGRLAEAPCRFSDGFCSTYQQAKREAEERVLAACGPVPAAIFRLSSIVGDSRDGRVLQFNYVHRLIRLLPWNVLPVIPLDPRAPVDLIPADWATDALIHLIANSFVPGRIHQVCAGATNSMPAGELLETTAALLCSLGAARRIEMPRFVSQCEYDAWAAKARDGGDRLLKEILRVLSFSLPHLGIYQSFENDHCVEGLFGSGLKLPPIRNYYPKVIEYCVRTQWGRAIHSADADARARPQSKSPCQELHVSPTNQ